MVSNLTAPSEPDSLIERMLAALPEEPQAFQRLCSEVGDWRALVEDADRQGVGSLLFHYLVASEYPLPPGVRRQTERQRAFQRLSQSSLHAALDQALAAFDAADVRAVALKGRLLAERFYPDPSLRTSGDLDLLAAPADLDRALEALKAIGYEAETGPSARYYRKHHHHIHLHRARSPMIELHFRLHVGFGRPVPSEPFLARAAPYRTRSGLPAWVLSPEDEFLHLSMHAAGHCFARLSWLYDLKLLARSHPELDWSVVAARAREFRTVTAVACASDLLRRRLAVPIPARDELPPPHRLRWRVAAALRSRVCARPGSQSGATLAAMAFQAVLCDDPALALGLLRHHLGRILRRRAQRAFPTLAPVEWSA